MTQVGSPRASLAFMCDSTGPIRILVADDDAAMREALRDLLLLEGYEVSLAVHGLDALLQLAKGPRPDVILSDVTMPLMNGLQLLREILKHGDWRSIPVVLFTASPDVRDGEAFAVLRKPVDADQLLRTLSSAARDAGRAARAAVQA